MNIANLYSLATCSLAYIRVCNWIVFTLEAAQQSLVEFPYSGLAVYRLNFVI